ncbi:MAG: ferric reductase-like transmembrane domain-containing protein [Patescibacteria group bacterium]|jgi:DMSO/TMAO reductase YedYZ heme-binding membrane subunit
MKKALRVVTMLVWLAIAIAPAYVFFQERDGLVFLEGLTFTDACRELFPLVGLYAFTLVWTQVLLGSMMSKWTKWVGLGFAQHRVVGPTVLLFALIHPVLLLVGVGWTDYLNRSYVEPTQQVFIYFGLTALLLVLLTALSALLRTRPWVQRWWRKVHVFNYIVFASAWIHSWNLGTDIQSTGLRFLWIGFGITGAIAMTVRVVHLWRRHLAAAVDVHPTQP